MFKIDSNNHHKANSFLIHTSHLLIPISYYIRREVWKTSDKYVTRKCNWFTFYFYLSIPTMFFLSNFVIQCIHGGDVNVGYQENKTN